MNFSIIHYGSEKGGGGGGPLIRHCSVRLVRPVARSRIGGGRGGGGGGGGVRKTINVDLISD